MASVIGMNLRTEVAQKRIDAVLAELNAGLEIEIGEYPTIRNDRVLEGALRREWIADALEAIQMSLHERGLTGKPTVKRAASRKQAA